MDRFKACFRVEFGELEMDWPKGGHTQCLHELCIFIVIVALVIARGPTLGVHQPCGDLCTVLQSVGPR